MVMLLYPIVVFDPLIVKAIMVVLAVWFDLIVALVICELVMFPVIGILTVAPLSVIAKKFDVDGGGVGSGVGDGL